PQVRARRRNAALPAFAPVIAGSPRFPGEISWNSLFRKIIAITVKTKEFSMSDQNNPSTSDSAENLTLSKPVSRRTLSKIGGTIATAAVAAPILAACGDTATAVPAVSTTAPAASATTAAAAGTTAAAGAATTAVASSGGGTLQVYWGPGHNYKA